MVGGSTKGTMQDPVFEINLQIWDTVGQEFFRSMNRLYYKGCHGCILVYDLSKPQTLDTLEEWLLEFLDNSQDNETNDDTSQLSFIVLGNKLDKVIQDDDTASAEKRQLDTSLLQG